MNGRNGILLLYAMVLVFVLAGMRSPVVAQEDSYDIGHKEIFGKLQRPGVLFPHDLHINALEGEGCGDCHHVYDENSHALVWAEGEETGCTECHEAGKKDNTPALREAYHGSCTACHRGLIKKGEGAGPATCGECHKR